MLYDRSVRRLACTQVNHEYSYFTCKLSTTGSFLPEVEEREQKMNISSLIIATLLGVIFETGKACSFSF